MEGMDAIGGHLLKYKYQFSVHCMQCICIFIIIND
jgi:hypothetical protein